MITTLEALSPLLPLPPLVNTTSDPFSEKVQAYATDLLQLVGSLFFLYQTGGLSNKLHEVVQLTLSSIACAGYVVALGIGLGGFTKLAVITAMLSTSNFIGAYAAYEAAIQLSLSKSADKIEKQVDKFEEQNELLEKHIADLGLINTELKITSEDLKKTNEELKTQVSLFEDQNHILRKNISDFEQANQTLHQEISFLREEIETLAYYNRQLKKTSKNLKKQVALFTAQNEEFRSLAEYCKAEAEKLLSQNQKYSQTQAELLKRFETQISHSDLLWEEIFRQLDANNFTHSQIIQQHTLALANLRQPELKEALKKDIREAAEEFERLRQAVGALLKEVQEKNDFLALLKKEHQEILNEKRTLFRQEQELFEANKEQVEQLKIHITELRTRRLTQ